MKNKMAVTGGCQLTWNGTGLQARNLLEAEHSEKREARAQERKKSHLQADEYLLVYKMTFVLKFIIQ